MKENNILDWIARNAKHYPAVHIGVGDDMAAINLPGGDFSHLALLKIDQALDQVHFDLRQHPPAAAGKRPSIAAFQTVPPWRAHPRQSLFPWHCRNRPTPR